MLLDEPIPLRFVHEGLDFVEIHLFNDNLVENPPCGYTLPPLEGCVNFGVHLVFADKVPEWSPLKDCLYKPIIERQQLKDLPFDSKPRDLWFSHPTSAIILEFQSDGPDDGQPPFLNVQFFLDINVFLDQNWIEAGELAWKRVGQKRPNRNTFLLAFSPNALSSEPDVTVNLSRYNTTMLLFTPNPAVTNRKWIYDATAVSRNLHVTNEHGLTIKWFC